MASNPTLDPDEFSRTLIQDEIRPGVESYLSTNFQDPQDGQRGTSISDEPGEWPPLVVTELPDGGRVLYPHVVISEDGDDSDRIDARLEFSQHDFAVGVEIHGQTATQMFNLRGTVRGWFLRNKATLRDAGLAEPELSGSPADWDPESKTNTWQLTLSGLVHTHPDA